MKKWYKTLFENYAQKYDKECFVKGTLVECDFIEQELDHNKNLRIIDTRIKDIADRKFDIEHTTIKFD